MTTVSSPQETSTRVASPRLVLAATSLAYFLVMVDTTGKNVALPSLADDLSASVTGLQWVVSSYLLVFSSLLLTGGLLCDRIGANRTFTAGFVLFGAGSAVSALGTSVGMVVAGQLVAGAGAALVTPASLAILVSTFTDPAERGRALGTWAAIAGAGTAAGPLLGGLLTSAVSWRAMFWINVPIVIAAIVIARRSAPSLPPARSRHFDPLGQVLAIAALALLTFGVIHAGDTSWARAETIALVAGGLVAGLLFVAVERRLDEPMVPVSLYARRHPLSATLAGVALNFCTYGVMFLLALYFQGVLGYSAVMTGVAELPMVLLCVLLPPYVGRVIGRRGPWEPLLVGFVCFAAGSALLTLTALGTSYWLAVAGLVLMGCGMAFTVPAVSSAATSGADAASAGSLSATLSAARQMGGVLGVSVLGSIVADDLDRTPLAYGIVAVLMVATVVLVAPLARRSPTAATT